MNKIIMATLLLTISGLTSSEEVMDDSWLIKNGFMPDNPRIIGNYQISSCIREGDLAALILKHKFQELSTYESELRYLESMSTTGKFEENKYRVRKEIIERIYNPKSPDFPYTASSEDERYRAIAGAALDRVERCLGVG